MKVEKRQQLSVGLQRKEAETKQKQKQAVSTERKGMTTRSRRPSVGETASKSQKVEQGDQATKPKVMMVKCSQEFIDWLVLMETKKPFRAVNLNLCTGSYDNPGPMLRCEEARRKMLDSHAEILQQYRTNGVAYVEVVDEPSV